VSSCFHVVVGYDKTTGQTNNTPKLIGLRQEAGGTALTGTTLYLFVLRGAGENWNEVMYDGMRTTNRRASTFSSSSSTFVILSTSSLPSRFCSTTLHQQRGGTT
jgi:hypothetical protein